MTFILADDGRHEDVVGAFDRYKKYLEASKDGFPAGGYALANSPWYHDLRDHRCPHDAWLEQVDLTEIPSAESRRRRSVSLSVRLLGAFEDGRIELRYPRVFSYSLNLEHCGVGHRDWRYDEFRVSGEGHLVHEIEWWGIDKTGSWLIVASDVEFRWLPNTEYL